MTNPFLVLVDDQPSDLQAAHQELVKRYAGDYEIIAEPSPHAALKQLVELKESGSEVAILFASHHMQELSGIDYLEQARTLFPYARRVLLIPYGNRSETKPILKAITRGKIDRYATKIRRLPDEQFHALVTDLLRGWQEHRQATPEIVTVIGGRLNPRSYELRDIFQRSGLPFAFYEADSPQGQALLQKTQHPDGPFPVLIRFDGQVLTNPTDEAIARALGVRHSNEAGIFDLIVVGAGPAGLSAAVYGASEGLRTIVIDRNTIGGQAGTSSLIRNYMGFPLGVSGAELTNRALDQAWSFGAETSVMRPAIGLRAEEDYRILSLADGSELKTYAVVLATGAHYQRLDIPSIDSLIGAGVFYGGGITEAQTVEGQHVFVAGAGNSAGQAAVHLAKYARQVTMLVRGTGVAASMSDYLIKEIEARENIDVRLHTTVVEGYGTERLEALTLRDSQSGESTTEAATALFVLIGAQPHTEWLMGAVRTDSRGFILTGQDLLLDGETLPSKFGDRRPSSLETSMPGVFAAGDVRLGSVKRVASAVGEGGVAIQQVHQYLTHIRS